MRHPGDQSFPCDVRRALPFADCSVARILAEHVIEHLNFKLEIPRVLNEFFRVLEPGGMVRQSSLMGAASLRPIFPMTALIGDPLASFLYH